MCVAMCSYFVRFVSPERCLKMGYWVRKNRLWNFHRRRQWSSQESALASVPCSQQQCFFLSILAIMWRLDLFLCCASEEQKWEQNCLPFVYLIVGDIYFPFILLLIDFISSVNVPVVILSGLLFVRLVVLYRNSSSIWDSNPSLSMYVVNMFPWSVFQFHLWGLSTLRLFNFYVSDRLFFFMVFANCGKHRKDISILTFFLLYSGTSIVSVFVFTSPEIYFCVGRNVSLYIFKMGNQSFCIAWIQTQLSSNAEFLTYHILAVVLTISSHPPSTMF